MAVASHPVMRGCPVFMDFVMIKTEEDAKALWSTEARTRHQNPINSGGDWKGDKKICPGESEKNAPAGKAKGYAMLAERTLSDPKQYDDPPDLTSEGSIAGWR